MALHPNGVHHLAISTCNIKAQIEFFTDVLGGELKALYWMHGVANTFHGFVELSPTCYVAFVQHPDNKPDGVLGVTHAGTAGGGVTAGVMQHVAFSVDSLDDLYAMRDRVRSRGVPVVGPMNHGMCQSMYFAGPEGLCLEVATGSDIDERAWIDPDVQALAGIDNDDLARYLSPPDYERPTEPVTQPAYDSNKPNQYPPDVYELVRATPDEVFWSAVDSSPPVMVDTGADAN
jgi:catechol 2,3-dioxygenase-like lactoylglutathione lyase family enzyme